MNGPGRRRPWLVALQIAVAIGVLAWLIRLFGTGAATAAGAVLHPGTVAGAVALGLVGGLAQGLRWRAVAAGLGDRMNRTEAISRCLEAAFLNAVLPGGLAGDALRAFRRGRARDDWGTGIGSVVGERLCGTAVVTLVAAASVASLGRADLAAALLVITLIVAGVAGYSMRALPATAVVACVAWSIVGWLAYLGLFALAAGGLAAAGVSPPLPPLQTVVVGSLVLAGMSIPLNVGGWGPREGVAVLAYGLAGLDGSAGFTTSVAYGLLALASVLPGALVLIAGRVRYRRPHRGSAGATDPAAHR